MSNSWTGKVLRRKGGVDCRGADVGGWSARGRSGRGWEGGLDMGGAYLGDRERGDLLLEALATASAMAVAVALATATLTALASAVPLDPCPAVIQTHAIHASHHPTIQSIDLLGGAQCGRRVLRLSRRQQGGERNALTNLLGCSETTI